MRYGRRLFLAVGLIMTAVTARADESAETRMLVEKAIRAQGGEAKLAKNPVITVKTKGKFHGWHEMSPFSYTEESVSQGPNRLRDFVDGNVWFYKFRADTVINGNKGWAKFNEHTQELKEEDLAELKEEAYADWVATLVPLKDKAFTLAPVRAVIIDKRPALGIRVSSKGRRDVKLFFDQETSLLVKIESHMKMVDGKEYLMETFLSDYKSVEGIKQAMKISIKRNGEPHQDYKVIQYTLAETADWGTFAEP
jgi:hypothetical protein